MNYEIFIKTASDLAAAKALQKNLQDAIKDAKALGQSTKELEATAKAVDKALAGEAAAAARLAGVLKQAIAETRSLGGNTKILEQQLAQARKQAGIGFFGRLREEAQDVHAAFKQAGGGIGGLFAAISRGAPVATAAIAGVTASVAFLKKGLTEYAEAERAVIGLDASLARRGQLTDEYREKLHDLADELQRLTGISDEAWLGVFDRLVKFGASEEEMPRLIDGVKNLAGVMGGDIQTAAVLMTRAMQGNFEMFRRYGIVLDENLSKQEKFAQLLDKVAKMGKGQLEALGSGVRGQFDQVKNAISDAMEAVGQFAQRWGVLDAITASSVMTWDFMKKTLGDTIPVASQLSNALEDVVERIDDGAESSKEYEERLKAISEASKRATQDIDLQTRALEMQKQAQDAIASEKMAIELLGVDRAFKAGKIGEEQRLRQKAAIRLKYEEEATARETELEAQRKAAKEAEALQFYNREVELESALREATQNKAEAESLRKELAQLKSMRNAILGLQQREKPTGLAGLVAPFVGASETDIADAIAGKRGGPDVSQLTQRLLEEYDRRARALRSKMEGAGVDTLNLETLNNRIKKLTEELKEWRSQGGLAAERAAEEASLIGQSIESRRAVAGLKRQRMAVELDLEASEARKKDSERTIADLKEGRKPGAISGQITPESYGDMMRRIAEEQRANTAALLQLVMDAVKAGQLTPQEFARLKQEIAAMNSRNRAQQNP